MRDSEIFFFFFFVFLNSHRISQHKKLIKNGIENKICFFEYNIDKINEKLLQIVWDVSLKNNEIKIERNLLNNKYKRRLSSSTLKIFC